MAPKDARAAWNEALDADIQTFTEAGVPEVVILRMREAKSGKPKTAKTAVWRAFSSRGRGLSSFQYDADLVVILEFRHRRGAIETRDQMLAVRNQLKVVTSISYREYGKDQASIVITLKQWPEVTDTNEHL